MFQSSLMRTAVHPRHSISLLGRLTSRETGLTLQKKGTNVYLHWCYMIRENRDKVPWLLKVVSHDNQDAQRCTGPINTPADPLIHAGALDEYALLSKFSRRAFKS